VGEKQADGDRCSYATKQRQAAVANAERNDSEGKIHQDQHRPEEPAVSERVMQDHARDPAKCGDRLKTED
jgi:hypothetical protein